MDSRSGAIPNIKNFAVAIVAIGLFVAIIVGNFIDANRKVEASQQLRRMLPTVDSAGLAFRESLVASGDTSAASPLRRYVGDIDAVLRHPNVRYDGINWHALRNLRLLGPQDLGLIDSDSTWVAWRAEKARWDSAYDRAYPSLPEPSLH